MRWVQITELKEKILENEIENFPKKLLSSSQGPGNKCKHARVQYRYQQKFRNLYS